MNTHELHDKMSVYVCRFEIFTEDGTQIRTVQAPRIMIEQQILTLLNDSIACQRPVKFKVTRNEPFWNRFDGKWSDGEYSIEYANNAYIDVYGELG